MLIQADCWCVCFLDTLKYLKEKKDFRSLPAFDPITLTFRENHDLGSQLVVQEVNSKFWVTWPRIAQFVYFLREMCLFFNFWMIKFTIMFFYIHAWKDCATVFLKWTNFSKILGYKVRPLKQICRLRICENMSWASWKIQ